MSLVLDIIIPEASQVPEENGDQLWVGRNFAEAEEIDPDTLLGGRLKIFQRN